MKYIIEEDDLRGLLYSYYKLEALEYGGVDNWEWYSDSLHGFMEDYIRDNKTLLGDIDEDFWFTDLARHEIKNYGEAKIN